MQLHPPTHRWQYPTGRWAILAAIALACGPNPDASLFIFGTAEDENSQPVPSVMVRLKEQAASHCGVEWFGDSYFAPNGASVPAPTREIAAGPTDAAGAFVFEVPAHEVRLVSRDGACFLVRLGEAPGTSLRLDALVTDVDATATPHLSSVSPQVTVAADVISVRFDAPEARTESLIEPGPFMPKATAYEVRLSRGADLLWAQEFESSAEDIDYRLAQGASDISVSIALLAKRHANAKLAALSPTTYDVLAESNGQVVTLPSSDPPSLGAACKAGERDLEPCPFTDGRSEIRNVGLDENGALVDSTGALEVHWSVPTEVRFLLLRDFYIHSLNGAIEVKSVTDSGDVATIGTLNLHASGEPMSAYDYVRRDAGRYRFARVNLKPAVTNRLRLTGLRAYALSEFTVY